MGIKNVVVGGVIVASLLGGTYAVYPSGANEKLVKSMVLENQNAISQYTTGKNSEALDVADGYTSGDFSHKSLNDYISNIKNQDALKVMAEHFIDRKVDFNTALSSSRADTGLQILKKIDNNEFLKVLANSSLVNAMALDDYGAIQTVASVKTGEAFGIAKGYTEGDFSDRSFFEYISMINDNDALNVMVEHFIDRKVNFNTSLSRSNASKAIHLMREAGHGEFLDVFSNKTLLIALALENESAIRHLANGRESEAEKVAKRYVEGSFSTGSLIEYVSVVDDKDAFDAMVDVFIDYKVNFSTASSNSKAEKGLEVMKEVMQDKGFKISKSDIPAFYITLTNSNQRV